MKSMRKKNGRLKEGKSMRQTESRQDAIKVGSIAPRPPLKTRACSNEKKEKIMYNVHFSYQAWHHQYTRSQLPRNIDTGKVHNCHVQIFEGDMKSKFSM